MKQNNKKIIIKVQFKKITKNQLDYMILYEQLYGKEILMLISLLKELILIKY